MKTGATTGLARRLQKLRTDRMSMGQPVVAKAIGVSVPLISAWENGKAVPSESRLRRYAEFFAPIRAAEVNGGSPMTHSLTRDEIEVNEGLLRTELTTLRAKAVDGPRSPWQYPAGEPITIACSELTPRYRDLHPYSDPSSPDHIRASRFADLDALIEIYGYLKALNPNSDVKTRGASELTTEDRQDHLIALGGIDFNRLARKVLLNPELAGPFIQDGRPSDESGGGFSINTPAAERHFRPQFNYFEGVKILTEDVALFMRLPNPYYSERTLTLCNGMYGRGTLAMVCVFTDPKRRAGNIAYVHERFENSHTFGILSRVAVEENEIVVPDWTKQRNRLHEWQGPIGEQA